MLGRLRIWIGALALTLASANLAVAGPFIFSGTDSDDHGGTSLGQNVDGWLFMQKALENLAANVTNGNMTVSILGSTSTAASAATSAFNLSTLPGLGWSLETIASANFGTFFGAGGGLDNSGILMMDSGNNVSGGVDGSAFVPHATAINNFVGAGGGLFSQANGYDWVSALVPTLNVVNFSSSNDLTLTAAGNAAFPGLTNADLSTGPWHNYFTNTNPIPVLATSPGPQGGPEALILGASTGSITDPGDPGVPEPATLLLFGIGIAAAGRRMRRRYQ